MVAAFSRVDQRRGGGHGRTALARYLTSDVASYLHGGFSDTGLRAAMFSTAGELAYLCGWMAFDNAEHALAQRYFTVALKLTAEVMEFVASADTTLSGSQLASEVEARFGVTLHRRTIERARR